MKDAALIRGAAATPPLSCRERPEGTRRPCCGEAALSPPYVAPCAPVTWVRGPPSSFRPQRRRYDLSGRSCVVRSWAR